MILVLMGAVGDRAADRLRRRRQPDADARRRAPARARGALRARRQPGARRAAAAHRRLRARAIGGAVGLLLAYWTMRATAVASRATRCRGPSRSASIARVVAFTVALAAADAARVRRRAGAARRDAHPPSTRSKKAAAAPPGRARQRLLGSLVVAQFALALMLSVGAGLLVRSFVRLLGTIPASGPMHVVTASVHAAGRALSTACAGEGVLPAGRGRARADSRRDGRAAPAPTARCTSKSGARSRRCDAARPCSTRVA